MKNKIILSVFALLAFHKLYAGRAEVFGTNESFFEGVADRMQIPEKIQDSWSQISSMLDLNASPGPIVYLYPFGHPKQPDLLKPLLEKTFVNAGIAGQPEKIEAATNSIFGITFTEDTYPANSPVFARVIQINVKQLFVQESAAARGYGLYTTAHEMLHYALRLREVPNGLHHCVMAHEKNGVSLNTKILDHLLAKDWITEHFRSPKPGYIGYAESLEHCERDKKFFEAQGGPDAVKALLDEVASTANSLL